MLVHLCCGGVLPHEVEGVALPVGRESELLRVISNGMCGIVGGVMRDFWDSSWLRSKSWNI